MDDLHSVARLIDALRPWLGELVIVGGWAHRLHRLLPEARVPAYAPLRTRDADLAFSTTARLGGDMRAALQAAGFREELSGDHVPPVSCYRLGDADRGFYAEFLAPLTGSGVRRGGAADATVARAGVTAQKLRYVELLLTHPWTVRLEGMPETPLSAPAEVRLANPVSFIAQKLLIQSDRTPAKQAQDALYVHDTLELFGRELRTLRNVWRDVVRPTLTPKAARRVERLSEERFGAVTDVLRTAARMPQDRRLTPERMRGACAYGLREIFTA